MSCPPQDALPPRSGTRDGPRSPGEEPSIEEVRERLRALGYLQRPLDRFLLSGIARPGSFARRHAAVSLKVASIAGPLLGLLFALAVVVVNRPRLSNPLDSLTLALYYSAAFGAVVFLLEFAAGLALGALVRWRGRGVAGMHATAARAGFAVSLLVSAYLAYWWRGRAAGAGGPRLDALGLLALLVVNAALFRVSSLASLAALVRASDLPPAPARPRGPGAWILPAIAAGILTLGFFVAPRAAAPETPSAFERTPAPGRLLVVAWDGMPADLLSSRARDGGRSLLGRLASGAAMAALERDAACPEASRPCYWTTVATGRTPAEHGVQEAAGERVAGLSAPLGADLPLSAALRAFLPGRKVAVSSGVRRARAVWEILALREGVGAVGWWATSPAPDLGSSSRPFAVVSDRAVLGLRARDAGERAIVPAGLARTLEERLSADLTEVRRAIEGAFGARVLRASPRLEQAAAIDGYAARVAEELLQDPRIVDLFVYLPGLDIVRAGVGKADTMHPGLDLVEAYADHVEALLDPLVAKLAPRDWLVLVGDQGRGGALGREPGRNARAEGWILIRGPGVAAGWSAPAPWSVLDVAPTLLSLRGFPRSREMSGTVRTSFLSVEWQRLLPVREIQTFGENPAPSFPYAEDASEEEALERLRALGYVR